MRRVIASWLVLGLWAVACGGNEFEAEGSGGAPSGGAAGVAASGGTSGGGTPSGGTGATDGASGAGGSAGADASTGGSAGATGGSAGADASTGGTAGTDSGTDSGTPTCPAPSSPTALAAGLVGPEHPVIAGTVVYFSTDLAIWRAPLTGGTVVALHTDVTPSNNEGVTVISHNVIWADAGRGELRHLDTTSNTFTVLVSGQAGIQSVANDGASIYWTHSGGIRRRQTGVQDLFTSAGAYALTLGEAEVFWVTLSGSVYKGLKTGGSAVLLGSKPNPLGGAWSAVSIALDENHVYFSARVPTIAPSADGGPPPDAVWRVPRNGGTVSQVLGISGAEGIALSPSCIYMGSRGGTNGRIYVRSKTLTGSTLNLGGYQYPRGLAIDGATLIFTDSLGGSLNRAAL